MPEQLTALAELCAPLVETGLVVALTGAGVSAASGIPTFRGKEGYWTVGSKNYHPQELATFDTFNRMPVDVWRWYLHRRTVCRSAEPNAAHRALVTLDQCLQQRFVLITQNVDGLHRRAGSEPSRTYEIHGSIELMRCSGACGWEPVEIPSNVTEQSSNAQLRAELSCAFCGGWCRPHVLWFDECYDERHFRFESSLAAAREAELLIVVGSTGSTNLPLLVTQEVVGRGGRLIVIDPEPNVFASLAGRSPLGLFLAGTAEHWLERVVQALCSSALRSPLVGE